MSLTLPRAAAELFRVFPPAVRTDEPTDAPRQHEQPDTAPIAQAQRDAQAEQALSELRAMRGEAMSRETAILIACVLTFTAGIIVGVVICAHLGHL
jgi:hypothetical protein